MKLKRFEEDEVMNLPLFGSKQKKVHPKQCPKCGSEDILGHTQIIGYGYINLSDMSIDNGFEIDDFEIYDDNDFEYVCQDCDHEWE